jgi:hypothetical protein
MNVNIDDVKTYVAGLWNLGVKSIAHPVDFFHDMPKSGGLLDPMIFLMVTVVIDLLLLFIQSFVTHGAGVYGLGIFAISLAILLLVAVILSLFAAGILYVIWSFMGSNESYETSYRCLAYLQSVVPITILATTVPYLGLLGIAWGLYLLVVATREVHNAPVKPAILVFGIIAALVALAYCISVSSALKTKEHLREVTRDLQEMPGRHGTSGSGSGRGP